MAVYPKGTKCRVATFTRVGRGGGWFFGVLEGFHETTRNLDTDMPQFDSRVERMSDVRAKMGSFTKEFELLVGGAGILDIHDIHAIETHSNLWHFLVVLK